MVRITEMRVGFIQDRTIPVAQLASMHLRLYCGSTVLVTVAMLFGGLTDVLHHPYADQTMAHLGFPPYFQGIIGTWKLLAIPALLRGPARLKEWAYAGIVFDVSGAALCHALSGDRIEVLPPLFVLTLTLMSWKLQPTNCQPATHLTAT